MGHRLTRLGSFAFSLLLLALSIGISLTVPTSAHTLTVARENFVSYWVGPWSTFGAWVVNNQGPSHVTWVVMWGIGLNGGPDASVATYWHYRFHDDAVSGRDWIEWRGVEKEWVWYGLLEETTGTSHAGSTVDIYFYISNGDGYSGGQFYTTSLLMRYHT